MMFKKNPQERYVFFGDESYYQSILEELSKRNLYVELEHKPLKVLPFYTREYSRLLFDRKQFKKIFEFAKENNAEQVIFLSSRVSGLVNIKSWLKIYDTVNVVVILHDILESIIKLPKIKDFKLFLYHLFFGFKVPFLYFNTKNLRYLVLGESIKANLIKRFPKMGKFIDAIDHPYFFEEDYIYNPFQENKATFCTLGQIHSRKGGGNILRLVDSLEKNRVDTSITVVGAVVDPKLKELLASSNVLKIPVGEGNHLSREEYVSLGKSVDYALFFYGVESYKLTASGAFFDAISFTKPIIALKNDYFKYYFEQYGNIGFIFDTYEEMELKVIDITKNPNSYEQEYLNQVNNLRNMRKAMSLLD